MFDISKENFFKDLIKFPKKNIFIILLFLGFGEWFLSDLINFAGGSIGYKIREATIGRIPLIAVIGDKEEQVDSVALRALDGKNLGIFKLDDLYKLMNNLIEKKGRTE